MPAVATEDTGAADTGDPAEVAAGADEDAGDDIGLRI
jgi:hypothetical protein